MKYRLIGQARQDLLGIWRYIARDNEPAADRFIDLLVRRFEMLGGNPYLGRSRDDLRTGYRSFSRWAIYRLLPDCHCDRDRTVR